MKKVDKKIKTDIQSHSVPGYVLEDSVFTSIFNNNPAIMIIVDPGSDQKILDANEAACEFYGYSHKQFIKLAMGDINTLSLEERQRRMKEAIKESHSYFNFLHKTRTGLLKDVEVSASPVTIKSKKAMFIIVHDITVQKKAESKLRVSEERLELALEGSDLGLWDWHIKTGESYYNERWANIFGYTLEELSPVSISTWIDNVYPEDLKKYNIQIEKCFNREIDSHESEIRIKHKDGSWVWVRSKGKVVEWTRDGKPVRSAGTHLDITDRKLVEIKLAESEARFRSYFDSSPLALWEEDHSRTVEYLQSLPVSNENELSDYLDIHPEDLKKCIGLLKIINVNKASLDLYEADNKEQIISNLQKIFTSSTLEAYKDELINVYRKSPSMIYFFTDKTLKGNSIDVKLEMTLQTGYRYLATIINLTEQKSIENKLKESEALFRNYFESSPLSLWEEDYGQVIKYLHSLPISEVEDFGAYLDSNPEIIDICSGLLRIINVNSATLELYESQNKDDFIKNHKNIFTSESDGKFRNKLVSVLNKQIIFSDETIHKTFKGQNLNVKIDSILLPNLKSLVSISNITELKNKEYKLQELLAQSKLDTETKEVLLKEINHRVKNNLSSLIGILYAEKRKTKIVHDIKQIDLLNNLINRVKGISIAHDLLSKSSWKPISIELLTEKIVNSLKHLIPSDRSIETKISKSSIFLDADQSQSIAVIINELFVNSLEHAAQPGGTLKIDIKIVEKGGSVYYNYKDNGPGFSKEILSSKSFNVGLYLIKNIVEQSLRGKITLKNKNGALIEIQFPGGEQIAEI